MPPFELSQIAPPTHEAADAGHEATVCSRPAASADEEAGDAADRGPGQGARDPVEDAALPDVVAAGARHRRDQAGIGDRQERHRDRREHDRQDRVRRAGT